MHDGVVTNQSKHGSVIQIDFGLSGQLAHHHDRFSRELSLGSLTRQHDAVRTIIHGINYYNVSEEKM